MPFDLVSQDLEALRARLGGHLDDLLQTMLDVDAPPIDLFVDERPRLIQARSRALEVLHEWAKAEPDLVTSIYARLPETFQHDSVAESLLEAATWATYFDVPISIFNPPPPDSRVFAAAKHLVPLLDESGLVRVDGLDARPWGLITDGLALQYHQLLRRSFGANIHYELIGKVLSHARRYDLQARLALDERRLRYREEYQEFEEKDYWYGRPLSYDGLDDLFQVGETFHGDRDGGLSWRNPYAGLSVRWTADEELKTVEIEEFMPPPAPEAKWVYARYLHAIRDTSKRALVHCDGAVKAFAADSYPRTQQGYGARGKGDHYRKLFRLDGEFPASVWSDLACSWFRGNQLILEYFDGGDSS